MCVRLWGDTVIFDKTQSKGRLPDEIEKPVSIDRLKEIFSEDYPRFCGFISWLWKERWPKFCVSKTARNREEVDDNLLYFRVMEPTQAEMPEIIFLGQGKTRETHQVFTGFAAETLGFAFLALGKKKRDGVQAIEDKVEHSASFRDRYWQGRMLR